MALSIAVVAVVAFQPAGCVSAAPRPEPIPATAPGPEFTVGEEQRAGTPQVAEALQLTDITLRTSSEAGRDFDPDVSRDGKLLAFASTRHEARPDIFVARFGSPAVTQLTSDPADDIQPRFSPDGTRIAFASRRAGNWDIWLVNVDGTGLARVTKTPDDEIAPCWSPDGRELAYSVWSKRLQRWEIHALELAAPGVDRFLAEGLLPDWSPDGRRIAFQRAPHGGCGFSVWTIDTDARSPRNATELASAARVACIAPRWSPDGRWLAYCRVELAAEGETYGSAGRATLHLVEADGGRHARLQSDLSPLFGVAWVDFEHLAFVHADGSAERIVSALVTGLRRFTGRVPRPVGAANEADGAALAAGGE